MNANASASINQATNANNLLNAEIEYFHLF